MSKVNSDSLLLKEFNVLVSDISKSVFDKTIYKDLKSTENNVVRALRENLRITENRHRENVINLEKGIENIVNNAVNDFNNSVIKGEENFNNNISEGINTFSNAIYGISNKFNELEDNAQKVSDNLNNSINETINRINNLTNDDSIIKVDNINNTLNKVNDNILLFNDLTEKNVLAVKEVETNFKTDVLELTASMNKLKNKMSTDREYLSKMFEDNHKNFQSDIKNITEDVLRQNNSFVNFDKEVSNIISYFDKIENNIRSLDNKIEKLSEIISIIGERIEFETDSGNSLEANKLFANMEEKLNSKIEKLSVLLLSTIAISSAVLLGAILIF